MNGNMQIVLEEIAEQAEARVPCGICGNYSVDAYDDEANSKAIGMAVNAYKRGDFRANSIKEVQHEMSLVLRNSNYQCPSCGR
jgi:hypothetical protein